MLYKYHACGGGSKGGGGGGGGAVEYLRKYYDKLPKEKRRTRNWNMRAVERSKAGIERNNNSKKKLKLEVAQLMKRYMKMVRPLLSFQKAKKSNNNEFNRQPRSFSGNMVSSRRSSFRLEMRTAPASMRTCPANSGLLLASGTMTPAMSTTSDSTIEELHAAIQAAIAYCKSSISMEDKIVQA